MSKWEDIQRKKVRFYKKYFRAFSKALMKTIQPVIDEMKLMGTYDVNFDVLIKEDHIKETFLDLYAKVGVAFFKSFEAKQAEDDLLWAENMQEWCLGKCSHKITTITSTTKNAARSIVNNVVNEGIEQELSTRDITANLVKKLPGEYRRRTMWRASRIVRTEVQAASNMSVNEAARQTGLNLVKVWLTAPPGTARTERHVLMGVDNQKRGMNEDFQIGNSNLEYPGDPKGQPEDIINCHCAMVHERVEV